MRLGSEEPDGVGLTLPGTDETATNGLMACGYGLFGHDGWDDGSRWRPASGSQQRSCRLEAADGAAAMWTMASQSVDVLLLDLHLGRVDGTVVLDALDDSSTVVVFSGFGSFEESAIRKAFGPVVFECLLKPVPPLRLMEVVAAAARDARGKGHRINVRPITPPMALRLAMAGLARLTPQIDDAEQDRIEDAGDLP